MDINGIEVNEYIQGDNGPTIIVNTSIKDMDTINTLLKSQTDHAYRLIGLDVPHWNDDLSPWFSKRVFNGDSDCGGNANAYYQRMISIMDVLHVDSNASVIIAGYSLAGLFALYCAYQCDRFSGVVSASGSLWFPRWKQYVLEQRISPKVKCIYLSLGDKESKTTNPIFQTTEPMTRWLNQYYRDQGIDSTFEINSGNHFKDNELRLVKGIMWSLDHLSL